MSQDLIQRRLLPYARELMASVPVLVIQGARQVGKSTFAQLLVADDAAIFTLDDVRTLQAAQADPESFVNQFPERTMVIDEIQRHPPLILAIKANVDRNRRPGRFVLTGSSDLLRLERTPDSLAGRAVTLHLHPLSQGEIRSVDKKSPDDFVARLAQVGDEGFRPMDMATVWQRKDYAAALARGGYPEIQEFSSRTRTSWLDGYLSRIIQRDVADVMQRSEPARLKSVLRLLAANQAGELVKARLAQQADISPVSVTTYLDVLATVFLTITLPAWTPNLTHREVGRPKVLVHDSALAMRLDRLTEEQLLPLIGGGSVSFGALLEGMVASELVKQQGWSEHEYELFHYRDRVGHEVDIVIEMADGRIFALEVKASQTFKSEHFSGLRTLADRVGSKFAGGFVLNTSTTGYQYASGLWGLPISALWEW